MGALGLPMRPRPWGSATSISPTQGGAFSGPGAPTTRFRLWPWTCPGPDSTPEPRGTGMGHHAVIGDHPSGRPGRLVAMRVGPLVRAVGPHHGGRVRRQHQAAVVAEELLAVRDHLRGEPDVGWRTQGDLGAERRSTVRRLDVRLVDEVRPAVT